MTTIREMVEKAALERDGCKVERGKQRDRHRAWLVPKKVPDALAKTSGDTYREDVVPSASIGMTISYPKPPRPSLPMTLDQFELPFVVSAFDKVEQDKRDPLQSYLNAFYEESMT